MTPLFWADEPMFKRVRKTSVLPGTQMEVKRGIDKLLFFPQAQNLSPSFLWRGGGGESGWRRLGTGSNLLTLRISNLAFQPPLLDHTVEEVADLVELELRGNPALKCRAFTAPCLSAPHFFHFHFCATNFLITKLAGCPTNLKLPNWSMHTFSAQEFGF